MDVDEPVDKIKLRASRGSHEDLDVGHRGNVDTIRCNTTDDKEYCELQFAGQLADVPGGEFDTVKVGDVGGSTTLNPTHELFNTHMTGIRAYCAEVNVEDDVGPIDVDDRRLVCVDSDVLTESLQ